MALQAIYQHHERTTTADLEADLQLREIGIDPVQKFLTAYSEVLGTKLRGITQESPSVSLAGTLAVAGNATFAGTAAISGNTTIGGNLGVIGGTLLVTGDVTIGDALKRVDAGELLITNTASGDIRLYPSSGDIILTAGGGQSSISVLDNTDAVAIVGATSITGNTGITGTLGASGNFAINTNKFNVTASSGNFSNAGTASIGDSLTVVGTAAIGGNFAIATTKFLVNASTGAVTSVTSDFTIKDDFGLSLTLSQASTNDTPPRLNFRKARGTHASLSNASNGDYTFDIVGYANSNGYQAGAAIKAVVDGTFTTGDRPPSRMEFYTNIANGAQTKQLSIDGSGAVVLTGSLEVGDSLSVQGVTTLYNIVQYDSASDFFLMNINTGDVALSTNAGSIRLEPTGGGVDVTGAFSVTGTGAISGNFAINTNKFNVTSASGNTAIAGTLNVTGLSTTASINSTGNISIGSSSATTLQVIRASADASSPNIEVYKARGSIGSETDVSNNDVTGSYINYTRSTSWFTGAELRYAVDGTFTTGQRPPSRMEFYTNIANGAQTKQLSISGAGTVGVTSAATVGGTLGVTGVTTLTGGFTSNATSAVIGPSAGSKFGVGQSTPASLNSRSSVFELSAANDGSVQLPGIVLRANGTAYSTNPAWEIFLSNPSGTTTGFNISSGTTQWLTISNTGAVALPGTLGVTGVTTLSDDLIVDGITTVKNIIQYDDPSDFFLMNVNTGDVALSTNAGNIRLEPTGGITLVQGNLAIQSPSVPASASSTGTEGEIAWSSTHLYVCIATNTWKRVAIATW